MRQIKPLSLAVRLCAVALVVALLVGCAPGYSRVPNFSMPGDGSSGSSTPGGLLPTPSPLPALPDDASPMPSGSEEGANGAYGSVGLLAFPSVLVSVYLDSDSLSWTDDEIARSRENLSVAVRWITDQCAQYNAAPNIRYDDGSAEAEDSGLFWHVSYEGEFVGGETPDEGDDFDKALSEYCAELDSDALEETFHTSSIGFLVFLPLAGCSHTMVHYRSDGGDYYYEYSVLYRDDVYSDPGTFDGPAVYAHEILHLYGAPDLYEGSGDDFVDDALLDFVQTSWPRAIMYETYNPEGGIDYDKIDSILCPVTAFRLGLIDSFDGLSDFPRLAASTPGVFEETSEAADITDPWQAASDAQAA